MVGFSIPLSHHPPTPGQPALESLSRMGFSLHRFILASKSSSFCGTLKSLFMSSGLMRKSPLRVRTLDRTAYTQLAVPVIHDECVLGHPLQLVSSCRNVGVHWYLRDSRIPDRDPYVVGRFT